MLACNKLLHLYGSFKLQLQFFIATFAAGVHVWSSCVLIISNFFNVTFVCETFISYLRTM